MKLWEAARGAGVQAGCGDNSCIWGSPGGMATNGGCRCLEAGGGAAADNRLMARKLAQVGTYILAGELRIRDVNAELRAEIEAERQVSDERAGNIAMLEAEVERLRARLAGAAAELDEADASVAAALGITEHVPG